MKNFLRILALIFLLVIVVIIVKSGILSGVKTTEDTTVSVDETSPTEAENEQTEPTISETEEAIQEIIDPASQEEGVVILGGDGIPNN